VWKIWRNCLPDCKRCWTGRSSHIRAGKGANWLTLQYHCCENLKTCTAHLYIEAVVWCFWRFYNLHIINCKLLSVLAFLLRYRDESTVSQFNISATTLSQASSGIYHQSSLLLLWEQIYPTRHDPNSNSWNLLGLYLHLAGELSEANWTLFASSRLRKVHGSVWTEEQDSVGNSTYARHNMEPLCCKGDGCKL